MFYFFAFIAIFAALMVLFSKNIVSSILFLGLTILTVAILWLLAGAEFLALALVVITIGALLTLFLFVVMLLDLTTLPGKPTYALFAFLLALLIIGLLMLTGHLGQIIPISQDNLVTIGNVLYTKYMLALETTGVILLLALVAAINLFLGKPHQKSQPHQTSPCQGRLKNCPPPDKGELEGVK